MEERTLRVLTLLRAGLSPHRISAVIRAGGLDELHDQPGRFAHLISPATLARLDGRSARLDATRIIEQALRLGQALVVLGTEEYPKSLAALYDPPPILFLRGSLSPGPRRVAIVGARAATAFGRSFARDLARGLVGRGLEVVSGLARGIDGAAHEGALDGGGTTLAVLGSSLDIIYPREHEGLASRVAAAGGVLSELPPGTPPSPTQFPSRNRIIVGLCEAVIVVEAGSRSGALITARVGLEEGREVLAVPGRPADPLAHGPNLLIRDGATLVRGLDDVLEHLGVDAAGVRTRKRPDDPILQKLSHSAAKSVDQLAVDTGLAPPALIARLSELELEGRIERLPGTLFRSATPA